MEETLVKRSCRGIEKSELTEEALRDGNIEMEDRCEEKLGWEWREKWDGEVKQ